jgi:uncharacterized lipoprotein YbaY
LQLNVTVLLDDDDRPPAGSPLRVEIRDVSFADAPARVLAATLGQVTEPVPDEKPVLAEITCEVDQWPGMGVVWVHVDVDEDGRVSAGDYITKQSYPLPVQGQTTMRVSVRRV